MFALCVVIHRADGLDDMGDMRYLQHEAMQSGQPKELTGNDTRQAVRNIKGVRSVTFACT